MSTNSSEKSYGSLTDPAVQQLLKTAQEAPEQWTVYLVQENSEPRTAAQNRLYHTVVASLSQSLGGSVEYWREHFIERFLGYVDVMQEDGYVTQRLRSTSDLNVRQFSGFLNAILAWVDEKGLEI